MSASHFCNTLTDANKVLVFDHKIGAVMLALGLLYFLMSIVIIYFIKVQEYYARTGNDQAVRAVIFPIFMNVLWANALVNVYVGCIALIFTFNPYDSERDETAYSFATMYALQHLVTEGVALLLMQKGLGTFAATSALKRASLWTIVTLGFQIIIFKHGVERSFVASIVWQLLLAVFYGCLWLVPQRRLFRRPAVIHYARSWFLFRLLCIAASVLFYFEATHSVGSCLYVMGNLFPYAIFEPLLLYYTLLQDSKWWQGQDIFQGRRDKGNEEIRSPLQGIDINLKSALSLAASMDQMGHLTSTAAATLQSNTSSNSPRRNTTAVGEAGLGARLRSVSGDNTGAHGAAGGGAVRLLNFAYISLDKNKQLGSGSFSRVYQGRYRGTPCAVKLIFTVDLTVDVIKRVAAEAQLLSLIRHPNVVDILGVAVLPPSVCILLELCCYGSLGDALRNTAAVTAALCGFVPVTEASNECHDNSSAVSALGLRGFVNGFNSAVTYDRAVQGSTDGGYSGRGERTSSQISALLSVSTGTGGSSSFNLANALSGGGSTAAAAAANAPPQVTLQQIQALSLSWSDRLFLAAGCARGLAALHTFSADLCHRDIKSFNFLIDAQLNAKISDLELGMAELLNTNSGRKQRKHAPSTPTGSESVGNASQDSDHSAPALASNDILANWSAPEVIQGAGYTQAADVYGFALVLWEILVGRVPYSEVKRQDEIRRRVIAGTRPLIPACFLMGENAVTFAPYVRLIQRGWDPDPLQRPSILDILCELEDMLHASMRPLISTSDASLHLSQQLSARTGSITVDDPTAGASFALAAAMGSGAGPEDSSRPSQAPGRSFSLGSPSWWQGSFSPKPGVNTGRMSPAHPFSTPGADGYLSPAHQVLENLRCEDDGAALQALESSGGCHVLVMPLPPHEVVWATHSWCLMSGCDVADIVGKPLSSLPIFDSSSFVRIRNGSQRKGTLAAEMLEAPPSLFSEAWTACMAVLFGANHASVAAEENAKATSLFFKSLHSRYLHRARSAHAVISVLDFSSRTWNMSASQRTVHTLSHRIVSAVTGRAAGTGAGGGLLSADSGATAPGTAGSAAIDHSVPVICSTFSVHAYPVYQRTIVSSPVPIPKPAWPRTGFFGGGKQSFSASASHQDPSYWRPHTPGAALDGDNGGDPTPPDTPHPPAASKLHVSTSSASLAAAEDDSADEGKKGEGLSAGEQASSRSQGLRAENVALVCVLFTRLREPPQLITPLPAASSSATAGVATSTNAQVSGGGGSNRNSFRVVSTGRSNSPRPRRLTGSSATDGDMQHRDSCIEIPLSHHTSRDSNV